MQRNTTTLWLADILTRPLKITSASWEGTTSISETTASSHATVPEHNIIVSLGECSSFFLSFFFLYRRLQFNSITIVIFIRCQSGIRVQLRVIH